MNMTIHFNKGAYGEGIYFDIHIPKRFAEAIYFLIGSLPFQIRFENSFFLFWVTRQGVKLTMLEGCVDGKGDSMK